MENDSVEMMEPILLFENSDVVVINKPAGLIVHSDGRTDEPSVAGWVLSHYPAMKNVGEPWLSPQGMSVLRPGIIHRLDRLTSGVMVLAKTVDAYLFLKNQFQNRTVRKTYRAFVYGHPREEGGVIEKEIVRIRSTPPRWGVRRDGELKKHRVAVTEWRTLTRGGDPTDNAPVSYIELYPKTGRTHQLRVHLKAQGFPVVCDHLYAEGRPCLLGFERQALHAHKLAFFLPGGEESVYEAPLPEDFIRALSTIKAIS